MLPAVEVIPGEAHVVFGEGQEEYVPLPSVVNSLNKFGPVTSRWTFTDEERAAIAHGADVYLTMLTCYSPLQPVRLQCFDTPEEAAVALREQEALPPEAERSITLLGTVPKEEE